MHMTQGIPHFNFSELIIESGLLLDASINWISYHSGYDLGFLISLLINDNLPLDEKDFYWWCSKYFPNFYDLKHIGVQILGSKGANGLAGTAGGLDANGDLTRGNNKPSIEYLAEELHLLPISPAIRQYFSYSSGNQLPGHQHQQMTSTLHAYLSMECFKDLFRQIGYDSQSLSKYKGVLWGLGNAYGESEGQPQPPIVQQPFANGGVTVQTPVTPSATISKSGVVHFGRPI
ncbi:ribonuclease H-like protein [Hyphopichia burtonii NRRL Y-1933]|uniref:Ribonuclease H-like protein n=1 Tax=Hyphopichia burtonii NRRL Y-1933 TaxID=984485 RepID=A0A1E4RBX7_9ASCO|nr:ribonuclease H-like protein [Hyphopichia burtonii NRRL Y-1933]ODV64751.1 ribonuclease H-like protein [Hyphopichia burtonii NRRL Y-1933]